MKKSSIHIAGVGIGERNFSMPRLSISNNPEDTISHQKIAKNNLKGIYAHDNYLFFEYRK